MTPDMTSRRRSITAIAFRPSAGTALRMLLVAVVLSISACASHVGYLNHVQADAAVEPSPALADKTSKPMYLDLIRQMQQQGAYYASLANIDAYRQRYGNSPELRRLQADAMRATGQADAAQQLYEALVHTDQAGAAWHGLGLIAAVQQRNDAAESALAKAVQIDPVNVDYLGDLGYQRLRAGDIPAAHQPLAEAAELSPGSTKAVSNLVLWMLLHGDYAQAAAAMQRANLPAAAREQVQRLATQLQSAQPAVRPVAVAALSTSQRPAATASSTASPSTTSPALRGDGVPESMLERFGASSPTIEAHP
jgi:Flp pilus assembly protein TadD